MKTRVSSLIALLCILVYVTAVLFAAFQVYTNILEQQQTASRELDKLQGLVALNGEAFFTEPFREKIRKSLEDCKALQGLIITSDPKAELGFENGWGNAIRWDNGPHFITRLGYITLQPRQLSIPGFNNVTIYSMIKAVQYDYMADVLKQTLLVILSALLLSFLTMITTMLRSRDKTRQPAEADFAKPVSSSPPPPRHNAAMQKRPAPPPAAAVETKPINPPAIDDEDASFNSSMDESIDFEDESIDEMPDFPDDEADFSGDDIDMAGLPSMDDDIDIPNEPFADESAFAGEPEPNDDFSLPEFDDANVAGDQTNSLPEEDFHLDDFVDESSLNLPEVAAIDDLGIDGENSNDMELGDLDFAGSDSELADEPAAEPAPSPQAPSGLYSPRSNVGWEAYTQERLASELHRCAASEQDLVIMLMECAASVNCDGKLYKKIADEAIDLFNLKDLTFEYGNRGFTVIIPNENLEEGVLKAKEFHDRIYKTCYDSFRKTNELIIGLSSRAGRLVEAEKLLHEAARALEKAREEPESPVIAFKSDPEKYRDYIRRNF